MDNVIYDYLKNGQAEKAKDMLIIGCMPTEVARRLAELDPKSRWAIFEKMDRSEAYNAFLHMDDEEQTSLLEAMGLTRASKFASTLPIAVIARTSQLMPREMGRQLLDRLPAQKREAVRALLNHPANSVARIMRSNYLSLEAHLNALTALQRIQDNDTLSDDTSSVVFVVNSLGKYLGYVRLTTLIKADGNRKLGDLVESRQEVIGVDDDKVDASRLLQRTNLSVLPVVDARNVLVGALRFDDAMDVLDEDISEDIYKKAGVGDLIHSNEVVRSEKLTAGSIGYPVRIRLTFLLVTLAGGLMVGGLIDHFEDVLASVIAVAIFIPLIMDMGGNVGTQSTTIFARGLALGHINLERFFRDHLWREMRVGIAMATVIGLVAGTIAFFWQGLPNDIPALGLAVGIALFFSVMTASVLGFLLPWIMLKIGVDHAPGADPFITTIKDFSGLAVYFLLVASLLGINA